MIYSFVNRPAVKVDIINAADYYKNISPELAKQFLFRVREAKTFIARTPLGFQIKYNNVRTLLLKQFPYHIITLLTIPKSKLLSLLLFTLIKILRTILSGRR